MAEGYRGVMRRVMSDFGCIAHLVVFPPIKLRLVRLVRHMN